MSSRGKIIPVTPRLRFSVGLHLTDWKPTGTVTRTSAQTERTQLGGRSGGRRRACPLLGSLSSEEAERSAGDQVALEGEGVVDSGLSGEEALC